MLTKKDSITWEGWGALLKDGRLILEKDEKTAQWFADHADGRKFKVVAKLERAAVDGTRGEGR